MAKRPVYGEKKLIRFEDGTGDRIASVLGPDEDATSFVRKAVEAAIEDRSSGRPAPGRLPRIRDASTAPVRGTIPVLERTAGGWSVVEAYRIARSRAEGRDLFRSRDGRDLEPDYWIDGLQSEDPT